MQEGASARRQVDNDIIRQADKTTLRMQGTQRE